MAGDGSTRDAEMAKIRKRFRKQDRRMSAWSSTTLIEKIPDEEWRALHEGECAVCGQPGRLYPQGWACVGHVTGSVTQ